MELKFAKPLRPDEWHSFEKKTTLFVTSQPRLMDPADRYYIYVGKSTIPNAGEGLFAKRDIPEVVAAIVTMPTL